MINLGLLVGSGLIFFLAGELVFRIFIPQPIVRYRFSYTRGWEQEPNASYQYTKYGEFTVPIRYNSAGLRDREYPLQKEAGTFRIALMGDSFTEALQVRLEESYAKLLEEELNRGRGDKKYEVINFGVTGYGIDQHLIRLKEQALAYQPNVVLVALFANDLEDLVERGFATLEQDHLVFRDLHQDPMKTMTEKFRLFVRGHSHFLTYLILRTYQIPSLLELSYKLRLVGRWTDGSQGGDTTNPTSETLERREVLDWFSKADSDKRRYQKEVAAALLKEISHLAQENRAKALTIVFPIQEQVYEDRYLAFKKKFNMSDEDYDANVQQRLLIEVAHRAGMPVIDPLPDLRKEAEAGAELYFRRDQHLTPAGHQVIARVLFRELTAQGFLDP